MYCIIVYSSYQHGCLSGRGREGDYVKSTQRREITAPSPRALFTFNLMHEVVGCE
jgi:hypothetical protein